MLKLDLEHAWRVRLSTAAYALLPAVGKKGETAWAALRAVRFVVIPFALAVNVFTLDTVPRVRRAVPAGLPAKG